MANKNNKAVKPEKEINIQGWTYKEVEKILDTDTLKTEKDIDAFMDECFQFVNRKKRHIHATVWDCEESMAPEPLGRRKQAIRNWVPIIKERFAAKYPEVDVAREFVGLNMALTPGYEHVERTGALLVATAIWILDEMNRNGSMSIGIRCTPEDPDLYCETELPDGLYDGMHEESLIQGMAYVIRKRDADPGKRKNRANGQDQINAYMHSVTHTRKVEGYVGHEPPKEMPTSEWDAFFAGLTNRERFDTVMARITPVRIERAVKRFEKAMMDYLDLFYKTIEDRCARQRRLARDFLREMKAFDEGRNKLASNMKALGPVMNVAGKDALFGSVLGNNGILERNKDSDPMTMMRRLGSKADALDALVGEQFSYWQCMPDCYELNEGLREILKTRVTKEHFEIMAQLKIDNPYEICFAFLYLLDTGNDLPWLYGAGYAVMRQAARSLPWGFEENIYGNYNEYDDEDEDEETVEDEVNEEEDRDLPDPTANMEEPADEKNDEPEEDSLYNWLHNPPDQIENEKMLYDKVYTDAYDYDADVEPGDDIVPMSLAQTVYDLCRVVLPRGLFTTYFNREKYVRAGFTKGEAELLVRMLEVLERMQFRTRDHRGIPLPEDEEKTEQDVETTGTEADTEDTEEQIHRMKVEIERLKNAYYEIHRERNELRRSMDQTREEAEREHRELVDLRELVFNLERGEDTEEREETEKVTFPYETQKRTVVFGGHDTWLKAIKPMLPAVRFVDKDMKPNADLIRNADVIWIQPNAISHAAFYGIMDVARMHKKQVRYFATASAEKCARQLAEEDQAGALSVE